LLFSTSFDILSTKFHTNGTTLGEVMTSRGGFMGRAGGGLPSPSKNVKKRCQYRPSWVLKMNHLAA